MKIIAVQKSASGLACRALALIGLGALLAGCNAQPQYEALPTPELQANQACNYIGQGPGTPAYRTCYARAIRQFGMPAAR